MCVCACVRESACVCVCVCVTDEVLVFPLSFIRRRGFRFLPENRIAVETDLSAARYHGARRQMLWSPHISDVGFFFPSDGGLSFPSDGGGGYVAAAAFLAEMLSK